jgi:O-methyltransferase involved in polyketide biosynthesis
MDNRDELAEQTVQSTMLLPLYGRAKGSRMFPDILNDDEAIRIVEGMDYDFAQIDKSYATEYGSLACLILASGLFCYFEEKELREAVCRIVGHFPSGELFFDAQSRMAVRVSNRMVRNTGNKGSEMKFWVNDPQRLADWSERIRAVESVAFAGDVRKQNRNRYKLSTGLGMWGFDALRMGGLISIQW